jgi:hypothetical protein
MDRFEAGQDTGCGSPRMCESQLKCSECSPLKLLDGLLLLLSGSPEF